MAAARLVILRGWGQEGSEISGGSLGPLLACHVAVRASLGDFGSDRNASMGRHSIRPSGPLQTLSERS